MINFVQIDEHFGVNIVQSLANVQGIMVEHFDALEDVVHSLFNQIINFFQSIQNLILLKLVKHLRVFLQQPTCRGLLFEIFKRLEFIIVQISFNCCNLQTLSANKFKVSVLKAIKDEFFVLQILLQWTKLSLLLFLFHSSFFYHIYCLLQQFILLSESFCFLFLWFYFLIFSSLFSFYFLMKFYNKRCHLFQALLHEQAMICELENHLSLLLSLIFKFELMVGFLIKFS